MQLFNITDDPVTVVFRTDPNSENQSHVIQPGESAHFDGEVIDAGGAVHGETANNDTTSASTDTGDNQGSGSDGGAGTDPDPRGESPSDNGTAASIGRSEINSIDTTKNESSGSNTNDGAGSDTASAAGDGAETTTAAIGAQNEGDDPNPNL